MANQEHVERLRNGAIDWNAWREHHPVAVPDLVHADLDSAQLEQANLRHANLCDANLCGANLSRADLSGSILSRAQLHRANLSGANLHDADLREGDLRDADLRLTVLMGANFTGANLTNANLSQAILFATNLAGARLARANLSGAALSSTILGGTNMSETEGLESCRHVSKSVVDFDTLVRSGDLPRVFLRGVGLSDDLITYLPSLTGKAIGFYSCFISYSSHDQEFAAQLHTDLQEAGVRCWFAPHDMRIGARILDALDAGVRLRDKVLLILAEHSIASDWVEDEVTMAFEEERKRNKTVLFPVRIDDAIMSSAEPWAAKIRHRHIGDFREWRDSKAYKSAFDRLLRDLRRGTETVQQRDGG